MSGTIRFQVVDNLKRLSSAVGPFENAETTVNVFYVDLACLASIAPILSDEEHERSKRFCRDSARSSFQSSRTALRLILSQLLATTPDGISIRYGKFGKPHLDGDFSDWKFNISRSAGKALIACAYQKDVGIDLEQRRDLDELGLAQRYFSRPEFLKLRSLDESLRNHAFFDCWALKEAFVKSLGLGLHMPLDQFEVNFNSNSMQQALKRCNRAPDLVNQCFLSPLPLEDADYSAAIAIHDAKITDQSWRIFNATASI